MVIYIGSRSFFEVGEERVLDQVEPIFAQIPKVLKYELFLNSCSQTQGIVCFLPGWTE